MWAAPPDGGAALVVFIAVICERIGVKCESAVCGIIRNFAVGNRRGSICEYI